MPKHQLWVAWIIMFSKNLCKFTVLTYWLFLIFKLLITWQLLVSNLSTCSLTLLFVCLLAYLLTYSLYSLHLFTHLVSWSLVHLLIFSLNHWHSWTLILLTYLQAFDSLLTWALAQLFTHLLDFLRTNSLAYFS